MRKITLFISIFVLCLLSSCGYNNQFDWILGDWIRTNDEAGKVTKEHWTKESNDRYAGISYTLENNDTVFYEDMLILRVQDDWTLRITGVHEQPMDFLITSFNADTFTAENPENEFPKMISYQKLNESLKAKVANDEFSLDFYFEPIH